MYSNPTLALKVLAELADEIRKEDIKGEVLFRSFGIKRFYYLNNGNIIQRCKCLIKALLIVSKFKWYP